MPARYVVRDFRDGVWYHVYNKGREGKEIFFEIQDYRVFLFYMFVYLVEPERAKGLYPDVPARLLKHNLKGRVGLGGYCLMPNHFHLLVRQSVAGGISALMKQVANGYTVYFNQKYQREGSVFGGRFKAVAVEGGEEPLEMLRYIHLNPVTGKMIDRVEGYEWSSVNSYFGTDNAGLEVEKKLVLRRFGSVDAWLAWHNDKEGFKRGRARLGRMMIDEAI